MPSGWIRWHDLAEILDEIGHCGLRRRRSMQLLRGGGDETQKRSCTISDADPGAEDECVASLEGNGGVDGD
jgi:hypothetical protein